MGEDPTLASREGTRPCGDEDTDTTPQFTPPLVSFVSVSSVSSTRTSHSHLERGGRVSGPSGTEEPERPTTISREVTVESTLPGTVGPDPHVPPQGEPWSSRRVNPGPRVPRHPRPSPRLDPTLLGSRTWWVNVGGPTTGRRHGQPGVGGLTTGCTSSGPSSRVSGTEPEGWLTVDVIGVEG